MNSCYTPFLIQIDLRATLENCPDVIPVIRRALMRSAFDGKDGPTRLSFVKSEAGTAQSIMAKYQVIADHSDVTCLRVWATCPNSASSAGVDDPITAKINEAWRKRRKRRQAEDMHRADRLAVKQMKSAGRQPVMRGGTGRKPPQQPNKRELHRAAHNLFKPTLKGSA